jgi:hypothetical protein
MSYRSQKLALYIRKMREKRPAESGGHDDLLDRGFALLKKDLAREFHSQISDLNNEPGCTDTVGSTFSDKESRVFKIDEKDKGLVVDFHSEDRTVEIVGKEPIKFHYLIHVRLSKDGSNWCYAGGETMKDLQPVTGKLDMVVEKTLYALFGIEV